MKDNIIYLQDVKVVQKQPEINLDFTKIVNFIVDYTLEVQGMADEENIKESLKIIFDRYKNDYENINIHFE